MYISTLSDRRPIIFTFNDSGFNEKAVALIEKYKNNFIKNNKDGNICFILNIQSLRDMQFNTNLKRYYNE